jgi:hypothetical protein
MHGFQTITKILKQKKCTIMILQIFLKVHKILIILKSKKYININIFMYIYIYV